MPVNNNFSQIPDTQEQIQSPQEEGRKVALPVALGIIVCAGFAGWLLLGGFDTIREIRGSMTSAVVPEHSSALPSASITYTPADTGVSGLLYLTLAYPTDPYPLPYVFNVDSKLLATPGDTEVFSIYNDFSPNGRVHAFVGTTLDDYIAAEGQYDRALQVYTASSAIATAYPAMSEVAKQTNSDMPYKREVSVRDDGALLFSARDGALEGMSMDDIVSAPVNEWGIFFAEGNGSVERVAQGTHPKWIDSNRFMYLGEDGAYVHNMNDNTDIRFLKTPNTVYSNVKIDLADDGSVITWSSPEDGFIAIIKVRDWNAPIPDTETIGAIPTHAFWVAISPDTSVVAAQEVDWETLETQPNPRIAFYSLETLLKVAPDVPLADFDQKRMFLTDWR